MFTCTHFRSSCSLLITELQYSITHKHQNSTEETFHSNAFIDLGLPRGKNWRNYFMFLRAKRALFFFLLKAWELFFELQGFQKECVQIDKYMHMLTKTTSKKHEKYIVKHCIKARIRTVRIAFPQASFLLIIIKDNYILSLSHSFFSSSTHSREHTAVQLSPKSIYIYCNE